MSWQSFYLLCFVVGFALTVLSLLGGSIHLPLPHGMHVPHLPAAHGAAPHPHAGSLGHDAGSLGHAGSVPPFNFASATAFLAWFGGMGYLLAGYSRLTSIAVLAIAAATGVLGGALVLGFATRVLSARERSLDPADFDMVGVLGSVSVPIRAGGTGEILYSQAGTRRCSGARSEDGTPIAHGCEVVVTRYDKGIAYVRRWEELVETRRENA